MNVYLDESGSFVNSPKLESWNVVPAVATAESARSAMSEGLKKLRVASGGLPLQEVKLNQVDEAAYLGGALHCGRVHGFVDVTGHAVNLPLPYFKGLLQETGEAFAAAADQSLFASMRQAGIDWPVSCRNGACRTCIGQLVEGRVAYDIPWPGLSLEEKRDGYCLPCIAKPLCDIVLQRA